MRRRNFTYSSRNQIGMTLIEMVITLSIMGILMFTLLPIFKVQLEAYLDIRQGKNAMQMARIGFGRLMQELKRVEDSLDIAYGSDTRIDFSYPGDGVAGWITYEYDGTYLLIEREGHKLVEAVQDFDIRYFRDDGTQKSTPFTFDSDVWRIEIDIAVGSSTQQVLLSGQISPRNLHYQ